MGKRKIVRSVIALLVVSVFALPALAGTVYTNDSGITVRAFRIVFSELVTITNFGGAFVNQDPGAKAEEFVFSGGEAKPWDSVWLSWKPDSATVVKTEWLADVPGVMDVTIVPHTRSELFKVKLVAADGDVVPCVITRTVSQEQVPFVVEYHVTSNEIGLAFQWTCEQTGETQEGADVLFIFSSNVDPYTFTLKAKSLDGHSCTWTDTALDIPLHNETAIRLDATKYVPEDEIANVEWSASNWDPIDSLTFPIEDMHAPVTILASVWPNDLGISCRIKKKDGTIVEKSGEALIYFRKGTPFEIRATAARLGDPLTRSQLMEVLNKEFITLKRLGLNAIKNQVIQWYGYPDNDGNFTIQPLYADTFEQKDPRGYTPSLDELATYFGTAKDAGFKVFVELRHWVYQNDAKLRQEWGFGCAAHNWFKGTNGWLYGNGNALKHNILYYKDPFIKLGVDGFFWDAESWDVEIHGGYKTRKFITDEIIPAYREAGYHGDISYALSYFQTDGDITVTPFNPKNLDPYVCGIPWGSDEIPYLGISFYPTLATTNDATTEDMYKEALRQISKYLVPFSETYKKPIFIEDCYCGGYDGASIITNDTNLARNSPRDFGEQLRWFAALLRAFAHENQMRASPLIKGLTLGSYQLIPDAWMRTRPPEYGVESAYLNDSNNRPDIQNLIKVYFSDKPL